MKYENIVGYCPCSSKDCSGLAKWNEYHMTIRCPSGCDTGRRKKTGAGWESLATGGKFLRTVTNAENLWRTNPILGCGTVTVTKMHV